MHTFHSIYNSIPLYHIHISIYRCTWCMLYLIIYKCIHIDKGISGIMHTMILQLFSHPVLCLHLRVDTHGRSQSRRCYLSETLAAEDQITVGTITTGNWKVIWLVVETPTAPLFQKSPKSVGTTILRISMELSKNHVPVTTSDEFQWETISLCWPTSDQSQTDC